MQTDLPTRMSRAFRLMALIGALALLTGCQPSPDFLRPTYKGTIAPGAALRQWEISAELAARILALDPNAVTEAEVREVLAHGPTPRIIGIHGGIYPVYLAMTSFGRFLVDMGYPEEQVRLPRTGAYSYSCYRQGTRIAGALAWYYEREGLRPLLIGHSQGGMQAVKVLHILAGNYGDNVRVYNPLQERWEDRTTFLDPLTGRETPVTELRLPYVSVVTAGGLTRFMPNQWRLFGRLRSVPDTTEHFTGFFLGVDPLGGDFLGLVDVPYRANGAAQVRNVQLPPTYEHLIIPVTRHLAQDAEIRAWLNQYQPTSRPTLDRSFDAATLNILWAADVWFSIKRHWTLEAQRFIRARRELDHAD